MARTENPFEASVYADLEPDEDVDRIRNLLGGRRKDERAPLPPPEDPSQDKYQPLLDRVMKDVESNSTSAEEFTENYHRVLEVMKARGINFNDPDQLLKTYLDRWTKAQQPMNMPDVQPQSADELDSMERDKRTRGLSHGP